MSSQDETSSHERAMQSSSRANSALMGIYEISKLLTRPARLEMALSGVINLLASFLDMNNGLIALLDEEDRTSMVVGAGWSEATARGAFRDGFPNRRWARSLSQACLWLCATSQRVRCLRIGAS